jgi:hypothetical protein
MYIASGLRLVAGRAAGIAHKAIAGRGLTLAGVHPREGADEQRNPATSYEALRSVQGNLILSESDESARGAFFPVVT